MGWQSGEVGTCTCLNSKHRLARTARSLAQVLRQLLLLKPVPHVISSRWLLLPVTAARTHASCSGVVLHLTSRCECPIRRAGFSQAMR